MAGAKGWGSHSTSPLPGLAEAELRGRRSGALGGERQSWEEGPVGWLSVLRMRRALQGWEAGSGEDGRRDGLGSPSTRGLKVPPREVRRFLLYVQDASILTKQLRLQPALQVVPTRPFLQVCEPAPVRPCSLPLH